MSSMLEILYFSYNYYIGDNPDEYIFNDDTIFLRA